MECIPDSQFNVTVMVTVRFLVEKLVLKHDVPKVLINMYMSVT
jgi:hypothetical protein